MKIKLLHDNKQYKCNLAAPLDISIPVGDVRCFYATEFQTRPYQSGDFIGAVTHGAPVNFFDVTLNPHGNGTHTECLGHITAEHDALSDNLEQYHFITQLMTVGFTTLDNEDQVITKEEILKNIAGPLPKAVVIRTTPNDIAKKTRDYSGTNPPYLSYEAMGYLVEQGVRHLLLDLPSVDREVDDGILQCHHLFWNVSGHTANDRSRADCTITELIYVPDTIDDGLYLLNIQVPNIKLDAVPSKPVLYKLID